MALRQKAARPHVGVTPLDHPNFRGENILFKAEIPESWGKRILDIQVHRTHRVPYARPAEVIVAIRVLKEKDGRVVSHGHAPVKFFPINAGRPEKMVGKLEDLVNERFNDPSAFMRAFRSSRFG